jgi:RNA polymerase sigma-70 factor (ECF subfamily)
MTRDDAELLAGASRGDHSAFAALYKRYEADLYRFVHYLADGPDTAEELFQETWLRVVRHMGKKRVTDFKKWIFAIATNIYRDELRKRKVRRVFLGREPIEGDYGAVGTEGRRYVVPGVQPAAEDYAIREALVKAMKKLTSRQRAVFVLTQIEEFKMREVAEMLGKSEGTVKSTLHRAVSILRDALGEFR